MHLGRTAIRSLFALALLAAAPLARAGVDTVLSGEIKEADGTSGQDTNAGSGVKTGHLQNGAVTAPKLAPAAVGTAAIQDGAVTPAKLAAPIPAAKIDRTGLDADSVDGYHAADFSAALHDHVPAEIQGMDALRKKHTNVIVVAKDGTGDFLDPISAMGSITDASAENPYLVKIMPGVYDVTGFHSLRHVDVEGSGEALTRIRMTDDDTYHFGTQLYGPVEVRNLTIEMTNGKGAVASSGLTKLSHVTLTRRATLAGSGVMQAALTTYGDVVLDHVTVASTVDEGVQTTAVAAYLTTNSVVRDSEFTASGGLYPTGVAVVRFFGSAPRLDMSGTRVTVRGAPTGTGLSVQNGSAIRDSRVSVEATGTDATQIIAVHSFRGANTFDRCELLATGSAGGTAIRADGASSLAYSKLSGTVQPYEGTLPRCLGVYDATTYVPVACQ